MSKRVYPLFLFGPCSYWRRILLDAGEITLGYGGPFHKQTHRNRFEISGPNKRQMLSIPIVHQSKSQGMEGVQISYREPWQREHLRSIEAAYRASPFYDFYVDEIQHLLSSRHTNLLDLNLEVLDWITRKFGISCIRSHFPSDQTFEFKTLIISTLTPNIADEDLLLELPLPYHQNFADRRGFDQNLSVLDALMNLGPECLSHLCQKS